MSYVDVYFSRINHMGETTAERIRSGGIRSFQKWMAESPHTVRHLSVERGLYFDAIILTSKDKEYEKIMFLNVANNVPLLVGDIMTWTLEDNTEEKWIIVQEEKKVNGTYRTFWIIRCNYLLKWIDDLGHLQQSWAYVVSSVDSKIKGNYRTWNSLITPQPNKYAEILMPRYPIARATNFIIEDESWQVIEYDHTSVPGTIYLSLTENKINLEYDDKIKNIADTDKEAQYTLAQPQEIQVFAVDPNTPFTPSFVLLKNGVPYTGDINITYVSKNSAYVRVKDNKLYAVGSSIADNTYAEIEIHLDEYPSASVEKLKVKTGDVNTLQYYIAGPDKLRLANKEIRDNDNLYQLFSTDDELQIADWQISNTELATFVIEKDANEQPIGIRVYTNTKNKLESFDLIALIDGVEVHRKTIQIIPLW